MFLSHVGSRSKQFGNFHSQRFGEEENVFVRGHILLQFDIAEDGLGDVASEHLGSCNQHVLGERLLIPQPGHVAANEIRVASHNRFASFVGVFALREACLAHKIQCGSGDRKRQRR